MRLENIFKRCQTFFHRLLFPAFHKRMREMEYKLGPKPPLHYNCRCVIANRDIKVGEIVTENDVVNDD